MDEEAGRQTPNTTDHTPHTINHNKTILENNISENTLCFTTAVTDWILCSHAAILTQGLQEPKQCGIY